MLTLFRLHGEDSNCLIIEEFVILVKFHVKTTTTTQVASMWLKNLSNLFNTLCHTLVQKFDRPEYQNPKYHVKKEPKNQTKLNVVIIIHHQAFIIYKVSLCSHSYEFKCTFIRKIPCIPIFISFFYYRFLCFILV